MGCPEPRTREEILAELKRVNETIAELNIEIQPETYTDLIRTKRVLRWVLGMETRL